MGDALSSGWTRRRLLATAGALAAGGLVLPASPGASAQGLDDLLDGLDIDLDIDPAELLPTLTAYVDTLVPGPESDPDGTPGAVEAGAVEQLLEQLPYPAIVPFVVADVTAAALATHGTLFEALGYPEREAILVEAFADPVRSVYHLIAFAVATGCFYADFRNRVGSTHMGLPGPSDGYLATYSDGTGHGQPQAAAVPP